MVGSFLEPLIGLHQPMYSGSGSRRRYEIKHSAQAQRPSTAPTKNFRPACFAGRAGAESKDPYWSEAVWVVGCFDSRGPITPTSAGFALVARRSSLTPHSDASAGFALVARRSSLTPHSDARWLQRRLD